jgi:uncharacterized protein YeaO (DUF488 family)
VITLPDTDWQAESRRQRVLAVLGDVWDPELGLDVVSLGLVYDVRTSGDGIEIDMTLTTPGCPVSEQLPAPTRGSADHCRVVADDRGCAAPPGKARSASSPAPPRTRFAADWSPMASRRPRFVVARVYDDRAPGRYRVLVDRLWPRGIRKRDASFDEWPKDLAPSTGLRRWYGHDPTRFDEFARRYRDELAHPPASDAVARLVGLAKHRPVTLLTAARDVQHSGARVLCDHLSLATRRAE